MSGPIATIGSMHLCPMLNPGLPPPPHVGGPISGPSASSVLAGGKMVAVIGDTCTCVGPPDTIVQGEASVLVEGKQVATKGSMTGHGGIITEGNSSVLVGTGSSSRTVVMPIKEIPFPKINPILKTMASLSGKRKQLNEAIANQQKLRAEAKKHGYFNQFTFSF